MQGLNCSVQALAVLLYRGEGLQGLKDTHNVFLCNTFTIKYLGEIIVLPRFYEQRI